MTTTTASEASTNKWTDLTNFLRSWALWLMALAVIVGAVAVYYTRTHVTIPEGHLGVVSSPTTPTRPDEISAIYKAGVRTIGWRDEVRLVPEVPLPVSLEPKIPLLSKDNEEMTFSLKVSIDYYLDTETSLRIWQNLATAAPGQTATPTDYATNDSLLGLWKEQATSYVRGNINRSIFNSTQSFAATKTADEMNSDREAFLTELTALIRDTATREGARVTRLEIIPVAPVKEKDF